MKRVNKRTRQWLIGFALLLTALLIWWVYDYEPQASQLTFTRDALQQARERHEMLNNRLQRFSADDKKQLSQNKQLEALSAKIVPGKSIEEVNAQVQTELQKFLDDHDISLRSYQAMAPGKWRHYSLGKMQFRLNTTTRKFSQVLSYLEKIEKAISISGLNIRFQNRKTGLLNINLELSTFFMEEEQS